MCSREMYPELRMIGEYLPCSSSEIEWALSIQRLESASGNAKLLGEILVERECLEREALAEALESQRIDRVRLLPLLADLHREELARIGGKADLITLEPGETLYTEGQRGNSAYVMLSGRMLLSRSARQTEHPAGVILPGDVLGETEFFTDGTRRHSAYAMESSVLLKIRYDMIPKHLIRSLREAPLYSPDHIVRRAREVLRADRAYFFLRNPETGELVIQVGEGDPAAGFKVVAGTDIVGWVALTREIVNLQEAYLESRFDPALDIRTDYWTRTLLAGPILDSHGDVIGVLEVLNKRGGSFDADDEALLHAFTHQYAPALAR